MDCHLQVVEKYQVYFTICYLPYLYNLPIPAESVMDCQVPKGRGAP